MNVCIYLCRVFPLQCFLCSACDTDTQFDVIIKEHVRKLAVLAILRQLSCAATRPAVLALFPLVADAFVSVVSVFHCQRGVYVDSDTLVRPASPPNALHASQPEFARTQAVGPIWNKILFEHVNK